MSEHVDGKTRRTRQNQYSEINTVNSYRIWIRTPDGTHEFVVEAKNLDDAYQAALEKLPRDVVVWWKGGQRI